jgi:glycosyltransferase involved in cell wall biosynthesis
LARSLKRFGPFDVVHSHVHLFSGVTLAVAAQVGVQARVAHSHTDKRTVYGTLGLLRNCYYVMLRAALKRSMTHGIAVSEGAAADLFGARYAADTRVRVRPCGIDYAAFACESSKSDLRSELGIPSEADVVGHVGRFDPSKNHLLLIEALEIAVRRNPNLHLLFVGDGGTTRDIVEMRAREMGVRDHVTFAGLRSDVPRVLAAMDAFAFPSEYEGLGLALVEAQAAGLPVVVSDSVPTDALISRHRIKRLPPANPHAWAEAISDAAQIPPDRRVRSLDNRFDIDLNIRELISIYRLSACGSFAGEDNRAVRQVAAFEERREVHPQHEECQ